MQIQDLSYKLKNDLLNISDYQVSVEIFSLDNVYTVEPNSFIEKNGSYYSDKILWGNDVRTEGRVNLNVERFEDYNSFQVDATLDRKIRSIKLRFDNLPLGKYISSVDEDKDVTEKGLIFKYQEGWRSLFTPLLIFKLKNDKYLYISCKDNTVRHKIFFFKKVEDKMRLDVVLECEGTEIDSRLLTPVVECGVKDSLEDIILMHSNHIKEIYGLDEYVDCAIAPSWLKDISLVHSNFCFNEYSSTSSLNLSCAALITFLAI